jgi:hypothetical protein
MLPCSRILASAALLALASGCAGPPVPTPVEGLPVCVDFEQGHTKMEGSLRYPVRMRVLDGKAPVSKVVISGLRHPDDPRPRTFLVDDNAEYSVEWAQCSNERAPRSVSDAGHDTGKSRDKTARGETDTGYDCGETTVYKTEKLVTKKHVPASHNVNFAAPPNPGCWGGDAKPALPVPAPAAVVVDAGAPDAAAPPVDAGAAK